MEGWNEERAGIIDDVTGLLRDQRDESQDATESGTISFDPQAFRTTVQDDRTQQPTNKHHVIGPIYFDQPFNSTPNIALAQQAQAVQGEVGVAQQSATTYIPFLVMPYIYKFVFTSGRVEGFYLGLYALTTPPQSSNEHSVSWVVVGKASPYKDQRVEDSWVSEYDEGNVDYLSANVDSSQDSSTADSGRSDGGEY